MEKAPVADFLVEELEARRWSTVDLAEKMGGDPGKNQLALDLLIHNPEFAVLDVDTAVGLQHALGVSAHFWLNIDRAYHSA